MADGSVNLIEPTPPDPKNDLDLSWILLGVDRHGEPMVLDAAPDFYAVDLITELYACDNGIVYEKGLKPGLYKMTECRVRNNDPDYPEISGKWEQLA